MHSDIGATNYHHSAEKSFRINHDERFFSKLMAKESNSTANTSSRVLYYGEKSVAVPFMWEAQPGTPKHPLSEKSLPPLTPPPSYYSNSNNNNSKSNAKRRNSKANDILSTIWPITRFAKYSRKLAAHHVSPPPSSSNWSPSSSSLSSSSLSLPYSSPPSFSMRDKVDHHHHHHGQGGLSFSGSRSPPCSALDPPLKHKFSHGFRGCYPFGKMMKNATV